jgi:hypothetical protein
MTDFLNDISAWSILKWVVLVLIAGFIGQFGKMTAQAIMGKIRLAKARKQNASGAKSPPSDAKPVPPATVAGGEKAPGMPQAGTLDKKTLKTFAKLQKKTVKKGKK